MPQKTLLITGCSSGIGLDAARTLHARGWRTFATCRAEADCARLRDEGLESFRLDLTDPDSIGEAMDRVTQRTGGQLDAVFNNGAFACPGAVEDLPTGALRAIFETNLFGQHDLTIRAIPLMRAQGSGRIVNCSSVLGLMGLRWRGAYVATKFAMEGLTDVLRLEMRGTGIHIILIEPGPITTKIRENAIPHFERWINWKASPRRADYESLLDRLYKPQPMPERFELPPSAVTARLIHALESPRPRARYAVTHATRITAVAKRVLPIGLADWMASRL